MTTSQIYLPSTAHSVVHLDRRSEKRIIWHGEGFLREKMPEGTRVIYPPAPMAGLPDPDRAIRHALEHPEGSEPLRALLKPGMRVTIAMDDISLPLPRMVRPDIRERLLNHIVPMLSDHGVDDVHLIMALCLHRRMTPAEIKYCVGEKWFKHFYPDRLYNHDAEDPKGMKHLGYACHGEVVNINKRAAESDLLIYLNINLVPMDGGHKSVGVGLSDYATVKAHHTPQTILASRSYMDPTASELARSCKRIGRVVNQNIKVFHVETAVNNRMYGDQMAFLAKNEDHHSEWEKAKFAALDGTLKRLSPAARRELLFKFPAPYELIAVHAGATDAVHQKILDASFKQYAVPVEGQTDILIVPVSFVCPYNVNSIMNPLLVQCTALGYLMNMYRGKPPVKKGGTLIISHPLRDEFHAEHHPSYIEFFHRLLPETRNSAELETLYEERFAKDPGYVQMYRTGYAYHGAHPFFMWYWGENGRDHVGRIIVAGAEQPYVAERMGWEWASSMGEAIDMARDGDLNATITLQQIPPIAIADVR